MGKLAFAVIDEYFEIKTFLKIILRKTLFL